MGISVGGGISYGQHSNILHTSAMIKDGTLVNADIAAAAAIAQSKLTLANVDPAPHGAAKHTNVTRELFVPANGYTTGALTFREDRSLQSLADGAEHDSYFNIKVPDDFVSFTSVKAFWSTPSVATPKNMRWILQARYGADGEGETNHTDNPAAGETAATGTGYLEIQEPANPLTLANLAKGDYIGVRFRREGNHANDTLSAIVRLYGLLFTYTAEQ